MKMAKKFRVISKPVIATGERFGERYFYPEHKKYFVLWDYFYQDKFFEDAGIPIKFSSLEDAYAFLDNEIKKEIEKKTKIYPFPPTSELKDNSENQ